MEESLQLPEEALLGALSVQDGVPPAAHDAVVPLKGSSVVGSMHFSGHQDAPVL